MTPLISSGTRAKGIPPLSDPMIDRFCVQILPKINHKIKWLDVESSSMEPILLSTSYPNLNGLGLYDLALETARDLFTGKIFFSILSIINY